MKPAKSFAIGQRVAVVELAPVVGPIEAIIAADPASRAHGVVVWHYGFEHDPKNPRVRWASGWGTTHAARELRALTPRECCTLPAPRLSECDHYKRPTELADYLPK